MPNNCQIHTPDDYVVKMLDYIGYKHGLYGKSVLENSCGTGNILVRVVERYIIDAYENGMSATDIIIGLERDIIGYEIDYNSLKTCKEKLDVVAGRFGLFDIKWNINKNDYLKTNQKKYDYIIGNPPYITYHDLSEKKREWLKEKFSTCENGRFDYYYAFVEKSINSLDKDGKMIYLVPFNIFRNKYAQQLRTHIKDILTDVYDFSGVGLFQDVIISSTIIVCQNSSKKKTVTYHNMMDDIKKEISKDSLREKWFFVEDVDSGFRLGDYFSVHNGVATLLNDAFLIRDYIEDDNYLYINNIKVEKSIVKPAVSAKTLTKKSANTKEEKIIFPYRVIENGYERYSEKEFRARYPETYKYLECFRNKLSKRKVGKNTRWYEYGRSQALGNIHEEKLVFSMVFTKCIKTYECSGNSVPYAGYFLKRKDGSSFTLLDAKKILESQQFYEYVKLHGTPTTPESYRISVKEIEEYRFYDFGLCQSDKK